MKKLMVQTQLNSYPILISDKFFSIPEEMQNRESTCVIIADSNVGPLYLESFIESIKDSISKVIAYVFPAGEDSKSLEEAKKVYQFLIENRIYRDDMMIALGGGVTGDLTGYIASTYLRGIKYIQVPTSLLSQIDSSVGGKTAVNFMHMKNVIGAFYQPVQVQVNYSVLKTLPISEISNGLVEILVHAIIKDSDLFRFIEENLKRIQNLEQDILEELIYRNCEIKKKLVEQDEHDHGERVILNFGHTYGHAIESSYGYRYRHGECVAIGIIGACYIAEKMKLIDNTVTPRIKNLLKRMQVLHTIHDCNKKGILEYMIHDKKTSGEKTYFILPHAIGNVEKYKVNDISLIEEVLDILSKEVW